MGIYSRVITRKIYKVAILYFLELKTHWILTVCLIMSLDYRLIKKNPEVFEKSIKFYIFSFINKLQNSTKNIYQYIKNPTLFSSACNKSRYVTETLSITLFKIIFHRIPKDGNPVNSRVLIQSRPGLFWTKIAVLTFHSEEDMV